MKKMLVLAMTWQWFCSRRRAFARPCAWAWSATTRRITGRRATRAKNAVAIAAGGYADGYDVRIAKIIADKLGMDLEIVKTEWDGLTRRCSPATSM